MLSPVTRNEFVTIDDDVNVYENPLVISPDVTFIEMCTTNVAGNYIPLTMYSLRLDYALYGLHDKNPETDPAIIKIGENNVVLDKAPVYDASGYHLTGLLIHLLCIPFVFGVFYQLSKKIVVAGLTAMLFAIHPMHVESVAWVTERKDVLYALFYFASLLAYLFYLKQTAPLKKYLLLLLTGLLFVFSCAGKAQAVTLPVVLLLFDYATNRKWKWGILVEKIPFFLISLVCGLLAIRAQKEFGAIGAMSTTAFEQVVLFPSYALFNYVWKFVVPAGLSVYYPYPQKINGWLPPIIYAAPIIVVIVGFFIWRVRKDRQLVTGSFFFIANIILLLQILAVGDTFMTDRFSYVSYTGLAYIFAVSGYSFREKLTGYAKTALTVAVVAYIFVLCLITYNRTAVWRSSKSLFSDAYNKAPSLVTNNSLANAYMEEWKTMRDNRLLDTALTLCDQAMTIHRFYSKAHMVRASIYFMRGNLNTAIQELDTAYTLAQPDKKLLLKVLEKRSSVYAAGNNYQAAINDYYQSIRLASKDSALLYSNIARTYRRWAGDFFKNGDINSSLDKITLAIAIEPSMPNYFNRSITYWRKGEFDLALSDALLIDSTKLPPGYLQKLRGHQPYDL